MAAAERRLETRLAWREKTERPSLVAIEEKVLEIREAMSKEPAKLIDRQ